MIQKVLKGVFFKENACGLGFAPYERSEITSVNTSVNTSVYTPANASVNTPVSTSVSTSVEKQQP